MRISFTIPPSRCEMVFLFPSVATTPVATTALASGAKAAHPPTTPNVTMMTRYPMRANTRGSSLTRGRAWAIRLPSSSFFSLTRSTPRGAFSAEDSDERIKRNTAPALSTCRCRGLGGAGRLDGSDVRVWRGPHHLRSAEDLRHHLDTLPLDANPCP